MTVAELQEGLVAASSRAICRAALFEELAEGERKFRKLCLNATSHSVKKGGVLIAADEASQTIHRLALGWAVRRRRLRDGRVAILAVYLPHDIVGVEAMTLARSPDETVA